MTFTDYLINVVFIFLVARQARERRLDLRSFLIPLGVVAWVASQYVHSIPTSGNDLVLALLLSAIGLAMGVLSGFATHIRIDHNRIPLVRVGWLAGLLLVAGISARMVFVFAVSNGAAPVIRSFSITHHLSAAAWPLALVAMALMEVAARLITVQLRGHRMSSNIASAALPAPATA